MKLSVEIIESNRNFDFDGRIKIPQSNQNRKFYLFMYVSEKCFDEFDIFIETWYRIRNSEVSIEIPISKSKLKSELPGTGMLIPELQKISSWILEPYPPQRTCAAFHLPLFCPKKFNSFNLYLYFYYCTVQVYSTYRYIAPYFATEFVISGSNWKILKIPNVVTFHRGPSNNP
jgi:hypothetical protein